MAIRQFRTTVEPRTVGVLLTADAGATTLTLNVVATNTLPQAYPYTLVIDPDTTSEEIVTVTAGASNILTIVRAQDNTSLKEHAVGAVVRHMVTARDLQEPQEHMTATGRYTDTISGAYYEPHGLGATDGVFVGTTKSQNLQNKTITSATLSGTTTNSGTITGGTINATSVPASGITGTTLPVAITTATGLSIVESQVTNLVSDLAAKAPIASPTFTGTVTIPTGAQITSPTITGGSIGAAAISLSGGGYLNVGVSQTTSVLADATPIKSSEIAALSGVTSAIQTQFTNLQTSINDKVPLTNIQKGKATTASILTGTVTTHTVNFPTAFTTAPIVVVTPVRNFSSNVQVGLTLNADATVSGFTVCYVNNSGITLALPYNWIAIGS